MNRFVYFHLFNISSSVVLKYFDDKNIWRLVCADLKAGPQGAKYFSSIKYFHNCMNSWLFQGCGRVLDHRSEEHGHGSPQLVKTRQGVVWLLEAGTIGCCCRRGWKAWRCCLAGAAWTCLTGSWRFWPSVEWAVERVEAGWSWGCSGDGESWGCEGLVLGGFRRRSG